MLNAGSHCPLLEGMQGWLCYVLHAYAAGPIPSKCINCSKTPGGFVLTSGLKTPPATRRSRSAYVSALLQIPLLLLLLGHAAGEVQGRLACPPPHLQQRAVCSTQQNSSRLSIVKGLIVNAPLAKLSSSKCLDHTGDPA
jgi:hypothetical protein